MHWVVTNVIGFVTTVSEIQFSWKVCRMFGVGKSENALLSTLNVNVLY